MTQTKLLPACLLFALVVLAEITYAQETALSLSDSLKLAFSKLDSLKAGTVQPKKENSLNISFEFRTFCISA